MRDEVQAVEQEGKQSVVEEVLVVYDTDTIVQAWRC